MHEINSGSGVQFMIKVLGGKTDLKVPIFKLLAVKCIVNVCAADGINGADVKVPQVSPFCFILKKIM